MPKKLTQEEVLTQFRAVHGDRYDYGEFKYLGARIKSTIICNIHEERLSVSPTSHKKGWGCSKCRKEQIAKNSQEKFLVEALKIHGNKYDYSLVKYQKAKQKVTIICKKHGEFRQSPDDHKSGRGCYKCGKNRVAKKLSSNKSTFINKSNKTHNYKYDYSFVEYKNAKSKVQIVCPLHGAFDQEPYVHLVGSGCKKCAHEEGGKQRRSSTKDFINKAKEIHDFKYDYKLVVYKTNCEKVKIMCPIHGLFKKSPQKHLSGQGCPKCSDGGTLTKAQWIKYCNKKGRSAKLYIIKCHNGSESFIKFGITGRTVKARYAHGKSMPYEYEILRVIKSKDAGYIYDLENRIKDFFRKRQYQPRINFAGYTECLTHLRINKNVC